MFQVWFYIQQIFAPRKKIHVTYKIPSGASRVCGKVLYFGEPAFLAVAAADDNQDYEHEGSTQSPDHPIQYRLVLSEV